MNSKIIKKVLSKLLSENSWHMYNPFYSKTRKCLHQCSLNPNIEKIKMSSLQRCHYLLILFKGTLSKSQDLRLLKILLTLLTFKKKNKGFFVFTKREMERRNWINLQQKPSSDYLSYLWFYLWIFIIINGGLIIRR